MWNDNSKLLVIIIWNTIQKLLKICRILFLNYIDMWNANPKLLRYVEFQSLGMWNDISEIYKTTTSGHSHSDT